MGTPLDLQKTAYGKALEKDWEGMVEYYKTEGVHVLLPISVTKDCALHVAVQSKKKFPLDRLLQIAENSFPLQQTDVDGQLEINVETDVRIHNVYNFPAQPLDAEGQPEFDVEANLIHPVIVGNAYGNTALHLAAIVGNYEAIELLVKDFPTLVATVNAAGETALFMAASFGETKIVEYLATQQGQIADCKLEEHHRMRSDGTSILHIAVQGEHFDTALLLLNLDKSLAEFKDENGMTAFHLLANMPSAFKSGYSKGMFTELFYYCLPVDAGNEGYNRSPCPRSDHSPALLQFCLNIKKAFATLKWIYLCICKFLFEGWPIMKKVWNEKRKHMHALALAKLLIKSDFSWLVFVRASKKSSAIMSRLSYSKQRPEAQRQDNGTANEAEKGGSSSTQSLPIELEQPEIESALYTEAREGENKLNLYTPTPLFIATENGITEIVKEILTEYPQAVEHIDVNGRNILHVAVMHRRGQIFDFVKKKSMQVGRLKVAVDNNGYTLLHHAADTEYYIRGSKPGPALQLQEELQWFERVQEIVPPHFALHRSKHSKSTARELLEEKHKKQLKDAQKWVKDTSRSCSTVAVLIATVVFAAAYTIPGGYEENKGTPILIESPYFWFFTIMDVISLACSLTSVVMFLSILTSSFDIQEFRHSLPRKLMCGFTLLFFSVVTTMLTFGATILLMVQNLEQKLTSSILYISAFFPILVFALIQFRLYIAFIGTLEDVIHDIRKTFPTWCCKDELN